MKNAFNRFVVFIFNENDRNAWYNYRNGIKTASKFIIERK